MQLLHSEYLHYTMAGLDAVLWRYFRAAGYHFDPEHPNCMLSEEINQVLTRIVTPGEVIYGIGMHTLNVQLGAFVLLPQLDGTTLLQVVRILDAAEVDGPLLWLWRSAWAWAQRTAAGPSSSETAPLILPFQQPPTA